MKEQPSNDSKISEKPTASDVIYLILPLAMALTVSFSMALAPVEFVVGFFGLLFVSGLIVALTPHHH